MAQPAARASEALDWNQSLLTVDVNDTEKRRAARSFPKDYMLKHRQIVQSVEAILTVRMLCAHHVRCWLLPVCSAVILGFPFRIKRSTIVSLKRESNILLRNQGFSKMLTVTKSAARLRGGRRRAPEPH